MNNKKILIVSDYFYPHWTGLAKSIFNITKFLKNSLDFTVLTVQHDMKLPLSETISGITIVRTPYILPVSRARYSILMLWKFLFLVKQNDVIFINSPFSNILPIALISKLFGKKVVIFHQGDLILPRNILNRFIELVFDVATKLAFSLADKVSSYTEDYARHSRVLKKFMHKFTPLIPPILFSKNVSGKKVVKNSEIIFGFGGRFVEEKGFDILLNAIPEVLEKLPNAKFVFAGDVNIFYENTFNKLKDQIDHLSKKNQKLTILGLLKESELEKFYQSIDFVVIPSRSECFSIFQAEAMLKGAISIVADIPGGRYLVQKSGFGLTFKTEDPKSLAATIVKAYENKNKIEKNYQKLLAILDNQKNAEEIRKYLTE